MYLDCHNPIYPAGDGQKHTLGYTLLATHPLLYLVEFKICTNFMLIFLNLLRLLFTFKSQRANIILHL